MSYSFSVRLKAETLRSLAFGSIGSSYMGIGTTFDHPIRLIHVQNLTNQTLIYSLDGINDHFVLPASGFILLDITANKTREQGWYISQGTRLYAKEDSVTPTSGSTYLSAFYGSDLGS
jgi:hypothetical protein